LPAGGRLENGLDAPLAARRSGVWKLESQTDGRRCQLFWKTPASVDFKGVRVVRKEHGYPNGPTDGTIVYQGRASRCEDSIPPGVQSVGYGVFREDVSGGSSRGITAYVVLNKDYATTPDISKTEPEALERGLHNYWDFTKATVGNDGIVSADKAGKTVGKLCSGAALRPAPLCPPGQDKLALALPSRIANCGLALAPQDIASLKGGFTLSGWFWVKDESYPVTILGNYPGGTFQPGVFQMSLGRFEAADEKGRGFQLVGLQNARWEPGQWTHLLATLNPKEARVYLNGNLVAQQKIDFSPESAWLASAFPLKVGGINAGETPKPGEESQPDRFLDLVRIYDRALSEQEIKALYWMEVERF
jgi:hypothetical protein